MLNLIADFFNHGLKKNSNTLTALLNYCNKNLFINMIKQMCYDFIQFILNMLDLKLSKGGNLFLSFDILNIFVNNNKYTLYI